jgi:hypothetical protein
VTTNPCPLCGGNVVGAALDAGRGVVAYDCVGCGAEWERDSAGTMRVTKPSDRPPREPVGDQDAEPTRVEPLGPNGGRRA